MAVITRKAWLKFNGGIISRNADARSDIRSYTYGLDECVNYLPLVSGGLTRRGGFKKAYAFASDYSSSTPVIKSVPFAFKSEALTGISTQYHNVYVVAIVWNFTESRCDILIFEPSGTLHTTLTTDSENNAIAFTQTSIPLIRYDQKGDILELVDSTNKPFQLQRTGSAGSYSFSLVPAPINDNPFTTLERIQFRYVNMNTWQNNKGSGYHPLNANDMSNMFDGTYPLYKDGIHNEFATNELFCSWGDLGNHGLQKPDWWATVENSAWKLEGIFQIPATGKYTFAINSAYASDLFVDTQGADSQVASYYGNHTASNIGSGEFSSGSTQFQGDKSLGAGSHNMVVRQYQPNSATYGTTVAWRKESDADDSDGINRDVDGSGTDHSELSLTSRSWNGRSIYEIEIEIDGAGTFKWRKRARSSTLDDNPSWDSYEATTVAMNPGGYGNDITLSADISYIQGDPTSGTQVDLSSEDLAIIQFSGAGSVGDVYRFAVGFSRMPLSAFEAKESGQTENKFPYVVKYAAGRKIYGGTDYFPFRLWASHSSLYDEFVKGDNDDEGIETDALGTQLDKIQWIENMKRIVVGTESAIFLFPTKNDIFTPANSQGDAIIDVGSAFVQPAKAERQIFFVGSSGADIYEFSVNEFGEFGFNHLTALIEGEFSNDSIKEIVFTQGTLFSYYKEKMQILWVLTSGGKLYSYSFDRSQEFGAWAKHSIGGETDETAVIHSICRLPFTGGHRLYAFINRDNLGLTLEYIDPDAFVDYQVSTTSSGKSVSSGGQEYFRVLGADISALEASDSVAAFAIGSDSRIYPLTLSAAAYDTSSEQFPVSSPADVNFTGASDGESWSDQATTVYFGLYFESYFTTLPAEFDIAGGTTQGMKRSWSDTILRLRNALGRFAVSRTENSTRAIQLEGGQILPADYQGSDETIPKDFEFVVIGGGEREQLKVAQTSPTPSIILMLNGKVRYAN